MSDADTSIDAAEIDAPLPPLWRCTACGVKTRDTAEGDRHAATEEPSCYFGRHEMWALIDGVIVTRPVGLPR